MKLIVFIAIVGLTVSFTGAEDSKEACETLIQCLNDAIATRKRCDDISATLAKEFPPKYNEHQQSIANKVAKSYEYDYAKRNDRVKCLQDSLGNTTIVSCDKSRKAQCAELVSNYKQPRSKRQVAANVTAAPTTKKTTTLSPAQIKTAEEKAAAAAKAAADKKRRDDLNKDLRACQKDASTIDSKCSAISGCCSETWLCDLKFQQTPVFAEYAKLQYDLQIERRSVSCPASPPTPATAATAATAPTNPPAPTPAPAGRK